MLTLLRNQTCICSVTGQAFELAPFLFNYSGDIGLIEFSKTFEPKIKDQIVTYASGYYDNSIEELNFIFSELRSLYTIFYIMKWFDVQHPLLFEDICSFLVEKDYEKRKLKLLHYMRLYLYYSVNGLLSKKFYPFLENDPEEDLWIVGVTDGHNMYRFKMLHNILKVREMIYDDVLRIT